MATRKAPPKNTSAANEESANVAFGFDPERFLVGLANSLGVGNEFGSGGEVGRLDYAASQRRKTHGGRRDLMEVLGYSTRPDFNEYWARYTRQDVATRVIDLPVDQTWGGGPLQVKGFDGWEAFEKRLKITSRFTELDRLASIGEYAVLLIGVKEENPTTDNLAKPLGKIGSLDDIAYLRQYSRASVTVKQSVSDTGDERFGLPEIYEIDVSSGLTTTKTAKSATNTNSIKVHWSRVLHVTPNQTLGEIVGISRLAPILDRLHDLDKVVGGIAEMVWLGADRSLVIEHEGAGASVASVEGKADARRQLEEFSHGIQRILNLRGAKAKALAPNVPDPTGVVQALLQLISAGSGIPMRILVGSERGEMASTQDRDNFADGIANRRTVHAQPRIVVPFYEWLEAHVEGAPAAEGLETIWPPISVLSQKETAEIAEIKARTAKIIEDISMTGRAIAVEEGRQILGLEGKAPEQDISGTSVLDVEVDENDPDVAKQFELPAAA